MSKMEYNGYIDYPGVGIITDEAVHKVVLNHSRLIDRLSSAKMVEMSLLAQCVLMGIFRNVDANDPTWMFYGKRSIKIRDM